MAIRKWPDYGREPDILFAMLMVIFGAGASYDSSPTYPPGSGPPQSGTSTDDFHRPPLAKDLFANRPLFIEALDNFPQCKPVVPSLRDPAVTAGTASIEARLQEIQEQAETFPRGKQELAAVQCYIQRAIGHCSIKWREATRGVTNQLTLLREVARTNRNNEPVALVTFNYDTLLEEALIDLGLRIVRMEDYIDESRTFRLFKLHGSVNWAREIDTQIPPNINRTDRGSMLRFMVEHASELRVSDRFAICDPMGMGLAENRPVFPAIAIPVERKRVFECPQVMVDRLASLLPKVDKVMVIGWRATEEHFLRLFGTQLRRGAFVSVVGRDQSDAEDIAVRIRRALPYSSTSVAAAAGGFTEYVRTRHAQQILEAPSA